MIKDVLVCLESSASTEAAAKTALQIVKAQGAQLCGLAVIDEPNIRAGAATSIGGASFKHERDEALLAEARANAAKCLGAFDRLCRAANVVAETRQIIGKAGSSILREMQAFDLSVMGRDANFHFETEDEDPATRSYVLHRSKKPTILVPAAGQPVWKRVVIAYDGSSAAKRAIASFTDSGLARDLELHVATVDDDGATAWEMADRAVAELKQRGFEAALHNIVSVETIPVALLETAVKLGADAMVMGAYAGCRLVERVWGSVTTDLIDKTTISLFLQH
ncbi:MAG TPA: universal stress protein [Polyangia bacterium]|nr:universal stress protein [Polyangia bacterium]